MRRHLRLLLNVSFNGNRPYYTDGELVGVVMEELESIQHRDDMPRTTVLTSKITRVADDEWDPQPGNQLLVHNSPEHKALKIWEWIIPANNGTGGDVDDLIQVMNSHGMPCPSYLAEAETVCPGPVDPVSPEELARLREASVTLNALEAAGVDNWEGYDEAMQSLADS